MKNQNEKSRKEKVGKIGMVILAVVGIAGLLTVAAVAPNAPQALKLFESKKRNGRKFNYYAKTAVSRLKKQGFIEFIKKEDKTFLRLTEKGREELAKYQLREKIIKKPKRWDKKWRVIIFDIKEIRRGMRNAFRRELESLGFVRLQNSVWVFPYECEEISIMLKSYFKIGKDILYMKVEKIENDKWLKKEFDLI